MTSRRMAKQIKNYVDKHGMDCTILKNNENKGKAVAQVVVGDYSLTFWVYPEDTWETLKLKMDKLFEGKERSKGECPLCFSAEDAENRVMCTRCNNGVCCRCHMKMILRANCTVNCPFCRQTQLTIRDDAERLERLADYMSYLAAANGI